MMSGADARCCCLTVQLNPFVMPVTYYLYNNTRVRTTTDQGGLDKVESAILIAIDFEWDFFKLLLLWL